MGGVHVETSTIVKVHRKRTWYSLVLVKMDELDEEQNSRRIREEELLGRDRGRGHVFVSWSSQ